MSSSNDASVSGLEVKSNSVNSLSGTSVITFPNSSYTVASINTISPASTVTSRPCVIAQEYATSALIPTCSFSQAEIQLSLIYQN